MVTCRYCGREIPTDGRFCSYCGHERRYLTTNYDVPPIVSGEIIRTGGTISSYMTSGSVVVTESQAHPDSPLLNIGAQDYQEYSRTIPARFIEKIREGEEAVRNYDRELRRRERAEGIVGLIWNTNIMFESKKHARLFRDDTPQTFTELYSPCKDHHDFVAKISSIACLFEINLNPLRRLVEEAPQELKSIKLVELWLPTENVSFDPDMTATWKHIITLRNIPPLHPGSNATELTGALGFFGEAIPVDYQRLWDSVLDKFRQSLEKWQAVLAQISP